MADVERPGAEGWVPPDPDLAVLRRAAHDCRGCELYRDATQVVFSAGPASARIVLVGEQPGDREDLEGEPFVGPAGRLLASAVEAAGIDRDGLYVTNAVKHFRFERRGKRRIHEKPGIAHVDACRPWLAAERGRVLDPGMLGDAPVVITTHPSALLRIRGEADRASAFDALVADLRLAAETCRSHADSVRTGPQSAPTRSTK